MKTIFYQPQPAYPDWQRDNAMAAGANLHKFGLKQPPSGRFCLAHCEKTENTLCSKHGT